jgi:transposase
MVSRRLDMAGISPVTATEEQKTALKVLAQGTDRAEAARARALLLTLDGWTSARIAQAFGVREDTVRLWRSDFSRGGVDALRTRRASGPVPVKAEAALRVAVPLLSVPVEDRRNWTLSRLADEIARREGLSISRSQLSKVLRKMGGSASGGHGTR